MKITFIGFKCFIKNKFTVSLKTLSFSFYSIFVYFLLFFFLFLSFPSIFLSFYFLFFYFLQAATPLEGALNLWGEGGLFNTLPSTLSRSFPQKVKNLPWNLRIYTDCKRESYRFCGSRDPSTWYRQLDILLVLYNDYFAYFLFVFFSLAFFKSVPWVFKLFW